ncbi:hypothetical protein JZU56_04585, partial [bacterium]|nr:hypothetical protein [bacterium]
LKVVLNHSGGAGDIVGFIDTMRISGDKLLGDLHLLKTSPHREYILEIAERIPDTFGLSIAFSGPSEKSADKLTTLQRCSEIFSVDIVGTPAANPSGFFARKLKQLESDDSESPEAEIKIEIPMNDEMKKAIEGMIQPAMMSMNDKLAKLEAALPPAEEKPAAMSAQNEVVQLAANAAALAAVKEFAKSFGAPAAPIASAEAVKPVVQVQKFEDVVAAKATELKGDKSSAITFAIKNYADLYAAYRARVQGGELVKL